MIIVKNLVSYGSYLQLTGDDQITDSFAHALHMHASCIAVDSRVVVIGCCGHQSNYYFYQIILCIFPFFTFNNIKNIYSLIYIYLQYKSNVQGLNPFSYLPIHETIS